MAEDHTEALEVDTIKTENETKVRLQKRLERKAMSSMLMLMVESKTVEDLEAAVVEEDLEVTMIAIRILVQQTQRLALTPSIETTMLPLKEEKPLRAVSEY